jgi:hypothetical protein
VAAPSTELVDDPCLRLTRQELSNRREVGNVQGQCFSEIALDVGTCLSNLLGRRIAPQSRLARRLDEMADPLVPLAE